MEYAIVFFALVAIAVIALRSSGKKGKSDLPKLPVDEQEK